MQYYLITACALACVAQIVVAIAWHTWWTQSLRALQHSTELSSVRGESELNRALTAIAAGVAEAKAHVDRSALGTLRVEVDALAESVARLSRSNRAEFSRIYARIQQLQLPLRSPEADARDDDVAAAFERSGDPQLQAAADGLREAGVTRAGRTGIICTCGWCASCVERASARA